MALQGTIETFALPDVLRLLATSAKTGMLGIEGDRGTGALWVADGAIIASDIDLGSHPSTGSADVTEGLFQILRFESGTFIFTPDVAPASPGDPVDVESSISESSDMLDELNEINENVPGIASHVSLRPEIENQEVTLNADQWRVLSAVGSGTTVASIAGAFSFGELDALRRVNDLVHEGVIDISDQPAAADSLVHGLPEAPAEEALFEEPAFADVPESTEVFAVDEPVEFAASAEDEDAFASTPLDAPVSEEPVDPFAAPLSEVDQEPAFEEPAFEEPAFEEPAVEDAADPFASGAHDAPVEDLEAVDPFAPTAEVEIDAPVDDPFAPGVGTVAGVAAVGATGGVLHDVFSNGDAQADTSWEPAVETVNDVPTEWPAPNVAGQADLDAPWSADDAQSQLPPPPMPVAGVDPVADDMTSQLPPPPVMEDLDSEHLAAQTPEGFSDLPAPPQTEFNGAEEVVSQDIEAAGTDADSVLPAPPSFEAPTGAPDAEVAGVASFPEPPAVAQPESVASESNDMARQLASLSPAAARAVANAAKAETPAARDEALAEAEAEDSSVDRSLLLRFLGKSDKKES